MLKVTIKTPGLFVISVFILSACGGDDVVPIGTKSPIRVSAHEVSDTNPRARTWVDYRVYEEKPKLSSLPNDGIHDPANQVLYTLQEPTAAMAEFPNDRRGGVNWVEALWEELINPRQGLAEDDEMLIMDMDIMMTNTAQMPHVRFPHLQHTQWLACSNCHPKIFKPQKGANNINMDSILAGEHCGRCHDKVAFSLWVCERCHSVPHADSPRKWW